MSGARRIRGAAADERYVRALTAAERALKARDLATLIRQAEVLSQLAAFTDVTLRRTLRTRVNHVLKSASGPDPAKPRPKAAAATVVVTKLPVPNPKKDYRWFVVATDGTTHRTHLDRRRQAICGEGLNEVEWEGPRGPDRPTWCSGCQREIGRIKQGVLVNPPKGLTSSRRQRPISATEALQRRNEQNRAALQADLNGLRDSRSVRAIPVNFEGNRRRH